MGGLPQERRWPFDYKAGFAPFDVVDVARLLAAGRFRQPGVHAPETLGTQDGLLESVLGELRARGVRCHAKVEQRAPARELVGPPA